MSSLKPLASLDNWEATRDSLHAFSKVVAAPARVLVEPHPKWWHVSLEVTGKGFLSEVFSNAEMGGKELRTFLNLRTHTLDLLINDQPDIIFDLNIGESATALGRKLQAALEGMGLEVELPEKKYRDDSPRKYDRDTAEQYLAVVNSVNGAMQRVRAELEGERSPVQLWPHHFDLAFEWFGTKVVTSKLDGEQVDSPAQINFGFAPGDNNYPDPYFFSNPWPFEERLKDQSLPHGASWFTEGFEGTLLPYANLLGDDQAAHKLIDYYRVVFELAKPTLLD
jgi:hypothetical protein